MGSVIDNNNTEERQQQQQQEDQQQQLQQQQQQQLEEEEQHYHRDSLSSDASSSSSSSSTSPSPLTVTATPWHGSPGMDTGTQTTVDRAPLRTDRRILLGSMANLCSATLGAGILALPYAFYEAGFLCGLVLLCGSLWATIVSIGILVDTCQYYNVSTYEQLVERSLGTQWRTLVEVSIVVFCGGTAVGYVIAVGDIIERIHPMITHEEKRIAMLFVWCIAMLPLSCLRRMKSLECASSIGIMSICTLLLAAIVHLLQTNHTTNDDNGQYRTIVAAVDNNTDESASAYNQWSSIYFPANGNCISVLQACPIFFYAFSCQVNVAQIFHELPASTIEERPQTNTDDATDTTNDEGKVTQMKWVTVSGMVVCGILYLSVSFVTLLDFGTNVTPNILSCYDLTNTDHGTSSRSGDVLLHMAFFGMAVAVVTAFPLNIFPARVSLILMWNNTNTNNTDHHDRCSHTIVHGSIDERGEQLTQPLLTHDDLNTTSSVNSVRRDTTDDVDDLLQSPTTNLQHDQQQQQAMHADGSRDEKISIHSNGTIEECRDENDEGDDEGDDDDNDDENFHFVQHSMVTFLLAGIALGFALVIPNISVVFGLLGGTTSSLLGFIVPGLLGIQLNRQRISAWFLLIFGSIVAVVTTITTIYSLF